MKSLERVPHLSLFLDGRPAVRQGKEEGQANAPFIETCPSRAMLPSGML